jgi:outer membrane receptor protein involved in Fe transport
MRRPLPQGRLIRKGRQTLTCALLLSLTAVSPLHTLISQERPARESVTAPASPPPADSSGRRDSLLVYPTPPFWGSVDLQLPAAWTLNSTTIAWKPGRWFGNAFYTLPGFTVLDPAGEGQYPQLFARGVDARSVGFLANGRPVQDPLSGITNTYHLQWMDLDRAEIVTGPRSFLYGLNSQGAAVNLVSKDFNAVKPYTRIVYAEGPEDFSYSDGTFVQNISRRLNVNLGFQHLGTNGVYPNSPHEQWNIRGRARYNLSEKFALLLSGQYLSTQTGLNGGIDLASSGTTLAFRPLQAILVNADAYEKLTRHDIDLTLAGRWMDTTASLRATLYTSRLLREYRDEENRSSPNGVEIRSDHRVTWSGFTARQEFVAAPFSFLAGGMAEVLRVEESPNLGQRRETEYALWAKAEVSIAPAMRAAAFGRIERAYGASGAGTGADLQLLLSPDITLFGGVSRSDRLPNLFEKFWVDSTVTRSPISGFNNEHHTHAELGIDIHPSPLLFLRLALFHRIVENPIDIREDDVRAGFPALLILQGGPGGNRTVTGADAALSAQVWRILIEGAGTYLASVKGGGTPVERIPKIQARGGIYFRGVFFDESLDLKTGVQGTITSSFLGDRFNGTTTNWGASSGASIGAWSKADFVLTARIGTAHVDFLWENLTNVQAFSARYFAVPERGVWFRVGWEFQN